MDNNTLEIVDKSIDIILLSLIMLQNITNKSQEEILDLIRAEGRKTDELLNKLR